MDKKEITVKTTIDAPVNKAWEAFTEPEHVMAWNHASEDWHSPKGTSDLKPGGKFHFRMEAKDKSEGFDFNGTYDKVEPLKFISYTLDDGRKVTVKFDEQGMKTKVIETFEAEDMNPVKMQKEGWQSILDNYKKHAESI